MTATALGLHGAIAHSSPISCATDRAQTQGVLTTVKRSSLIWIRIRSILELGSENNLDTPSITMPKYFALVEGPSLHFCTFIVRPAAVAANTNSMADTSAASAVGDTNKKLGMWCVCYHGVTHPYFA